MLVLVGKSLINKRENITCLWNQIFGHLCKEKCESESCISGKNFIKLETWRSKNTIFQVMNYHHVILYQETLNRLDIFSWEI